MADSTSHKNQYKGNVKKTVTRIQRPLQSGRAFKFFCCARKSVIIGGTTDASDSGNISPNVKSTVNATRIWGSNSNLQYDTTSLPLNYDGCSLIQLLFDNEPTTFDACKVVASKHPDMWKYYSSVPVYYGIRCTIERAYIILSTGTSGATSSTDLQFAQNLANGQSFDFYWYWDSQNMNSVVEFGTTTDRLSYMLDNRKFKIGRHKAGDGAKCSMNCKMGLPQLTSVSGNPYPFPNAPTDSCGAALRQFFSNAVSAELAKLNPPGGLYVAPVMPLSNTTFATLFNGADNVDHARLVIDFNFTTKLIIKSSNYIGYMVPWTDGTNKIPNDIGT